MDEGSYWYAWFGGASNINDTNLDWCRLFITLNTVGAGQATTMLWETTPPPLNAPGPKAWISEQEMAANHLEHNLREIDSIYFTGQIAARVQILVYKPIAGNWTNWMDSLLPHCGGQPAKDNNNKFDRSNIKVEERPSPLQLVAVASAKTADTCHDLKSGFMEQ